MRNGIEPLQHITDYLKYTDLSIEDLQHEKDTEYASTSSIQSGNVLSSVSLQHISLPPQADPKLTQLQSFEDKLHANLAKQRQHFAKQKQLIEELSLKPSITHTSPITEEDRSSHLFLHAVKHSCQLGGSTDDNTNGMNEQECKSSLGMFDQNECVKSYIAIHRVSDRTYSNENDAFQRQDVSMMAIRKQVDMLRRLQVENNTFRHENKNLKQQSDVLNNQNQRLQREVRRHQTMLEEKSRQADMVEEKLNNKIHQLTQNINDYKKNLKGAEATTLSLEESRKQILFMEQKLACQSKNLSDARKESKTSLTTITAQLQKASNAISTLKKQLKFNKRKEIDLQVENKDLKENIANLTTKLENLELRTNDLCCQVSEQNEINNNLEHTLKFKTEEQETRFNDLMLELNSRQEKLKRLEYERSNLQLQLSDAVRGTKQANCANQHLNDQLSDTKLQVQKLEQTYRQLQQTHQQTIINYKEQQCSDGDSIMRLKTHYENLQLEVIHSNAKLKSRNEWFAAQNKRLISNINDISNSIKNTFSKRKVVEIRTQDDRVSGIVAESINDQPDENSVSKELQESIEKLSCDVTNMLTTYKNVQREIQLAQSKLTYAQDHIVQLEEVRGMDTQKINALMREKQVAEEARETIAREKCEVLQWGQQMSDKNEILETELKHIQELILIMTKKLQNHNVYDLMKEMQMHTQTSKV